MEEDERETAKEEAWKEEVLTSGSLKIIESAVD